MFINGLAVTNADDDSLVGKDVYRAQADASHPGRRCEPAAIIHPATGVRRP